MITILFGKCWKIPDKLVCPFLTLYVRGGQCTKRLKSVHLIRASACSALQRPSKSVCTCYRVYAESAVALRGPGPMRSFTIQTSGNFNYFKILLTNNKLSDTSCSVVALYSGERCETAATKWRVCFDVKATDEIVLNLTYLPRPDFFIYLRKFLFDQNICFMKEILFNFSCSFFFECISFAFFHTK